MIIKNTGTKDDPWQLKTAPGTSEYTMYRDDSTDPPQLVCQVGATKLNGAVAEKRAAQMLSRSSTSTRVIVGIVSVKTVVALVRAMASAFIP